MAMRSATRAGWLNGGAVSTTPWPRRMRDVRWLQAARNTSGRRGVAVLLEEVVLDLPHVVEAQRVGELDLFEGVLEQAVLRAVLPGTAHLVLVEDAELHRRPCPM